MRDSAVESTQVSPRSQPGEYPLTLMLHGEAVPACDKATSTTSKIGGALLLEVVVVVHHSERNERCFTERVRISFWKRNTVVFTHFELPQRGDVAYASTGHEVTHVAPRKVVMGV